LNDGNVEENPKDGKSSDDQKEPDPPKEKIYEEMSEDEKLTYLNELLK
jgi:hypothetical protein